MRKNLKDWWHKELKRMHDEVDRLRKARTVYIQRQQEWERCRDAARIAEQGAELGATGENKVSVQCQSGSQRLHFLLPSAGQEEEDGGRGRQQGHGG